MPAYGRDAAPQRDGAISGTRWTKAPVTAIDASANATTADTVFLIATHSTTIRDVRDRVRSEEDLSSTYLLVFFLFSNAQEYRLPLHFMA